MIMGRLTQPIVEVLKNEPIVQPMVRKHKNVFMKSLPSFRNWLIWCLLKAQNSSTKSIGLARREKLCLERNGTSILGVHSGLLLPWNHCFTLSRRDNGNKWSWIASWDSSLITKVLWSSKNCWRWALASSLALPQKWLAYTIVIRPILISKFSPPVLTSGSVGIWLANGVE